MQTMSCNFKLHAGSPYYILDKIWSCDMKVASSLIARQRKSKLHTLGLTTVVGPVWRVLFCVMCSQQNPFPGCLLYPSFVWFTAVTQGCPPWQSARMLKHWGGYFDKRLRSFCTLFPVNWVGQLTVVLYLVFRSDLGILRLARTFLLCWTYTSSCAGSM